MGLIHWLTDIFGPLMVMKKADSIPAAQAKLRARIAAIKYSEDLQARSDQLWEDLQFRERFFNMRFDEEYKKLEFEARTGTKPEGPLGERIYPPYAIWHKETAKYADPTVIEKEWEAYNINRK